MKKTSFLIFSFLLSGSLYAGKQSGGDDTVVVKMKNRQKVVIISDGKKEMKKLKSIPFDRIMRSIDSSMRNLDSSIGIRDLKIMGKELDFLDIDTADKNGIRIDRVVEITTDGDEKEKEVRIRIHSDGKKDVEKSITIKKDSKPQNDFLKRWNDDNDLFEIDLGFNNYLENGELPGDAGANYGLLPFNSNIVNLRWMKGFLGNPEKNRLTASAGLEFSWNNYKYDQNVIIMKDAQSVAFIPFGPDQNKIKSKLTISWLNVPLMLHYRAKNSSFHMGMGGFAGYRLGSHSKTKFSEDGVIKKEKDYSNFYLNSLQYGLRFQVGFYDVDFFASYNLNNLFAKDKGPVLTPVSFGITL